MIVYVAVSNEKTIIIVEVDMRISVVASYCIRRYFGGYLMRMSVVRYYTRR